MSRLIAAIKAKIESEPLEIAYYNDLFSCCRSLESEDFEGAHNENRELRRLVSAAMKLPRAPVAELFDIYKRSLLFSAPHSFDAYMLYLEINRTPRERFYQPRRKRLKPIAEALQELSENKLDELFLSMPPRTGKTTILMFFITWIIGKYPNLSNLYSAYSDTITGALYSGVLEIINDPVTYLWHEVFPSAKLVETNAAEEKINIDRRKRYASLTCRSLYGTLNGACDCEGYLIADDLIGGIEEALNKSRLEAAWGKVDNNLMTRAKSFAKILWCATRWSLVDPIGLRLNLLETDPAFRSRRYKVISLPALDEDDESNFEYDYGVGFGTAYYRQRRASFERNNDMASWFAQYMQQPVERSGMLFVPEDMRYYNGVLPDDPPDRIYMAVDPAFGGGDFVAAPVCFQYGMDIYVHDVVYDNGDKKITQPLLVTAVMEHDVKAMRIEATKMTESYKSGVDELLKQKGRRINLTSKAASTRVSKEMRIFDKAPEIREHFIFRESGTRSKAYELYMQNVFAFKVLGGNKNDDAPDSLAMAAEMSSSSLSGCKIFKRDI